MRAQSVVSVFVVYVYGFFALVAPVLADSEFGGSLNGSDGSWGWNPPGSDTFGGNDFVGGGNLFGDGYGGGIGGGPFGGGGGPFGGGIFAGQGGGLRSIAFLLMLLSLFQGSNTQQSGAMAVSNLAQSEGGESKPAKPGMDQADTDLTVPSQKTSGRGMSEWDSSFINNYFRQ